MIGSVGTDPLFKAIWTLLKNSVALKSRSKRNSLIKELSALFLNSASNELGGTMNLCFQKPLP